jgi:hypothetical protein
MTDKVHGKIGLQMSERVYEHGAQAGTDNKRNTVMAENRTVLR